MKKLAFVFVTVALTFSLTSCKVNWFDKHYEVPWWVIAIPVAVFSLVVFVWAGKYIASKNTSAQNVMERFIQNGGKRQFHFT